MPPLLDDQGLRWVKQGRVEETNVFIFSLCLDPVSGYLDEIQRPSCGIAREMMDKLNEIANTKNSHLVIVATSHSTSFLYETSKKCPLVRFVNAAEIIQNGKITKIGLPPKWPPFHDKIKTEFQNHERYEAHKNLFDEKIDWKGEPHLFHIFPREGVLLSRAEWEVFLDVVEKARLKEWKTSAAYDSIVVQAIHDATDHAMYVFHDEGYDADPDELRRWKNKLTNRIRWPPNYLKLFYD
ncbi:hypothetical protein AYO21_11986 [Fonsecaea monophora]|uniref:Uncharacterized protein n=1 Tax=Fonsecaea monophora TaxID=254056 RepID=A0A177ERI9_9EURO|nr:hypothetical protein AYO21_11986 [Fonsecaea monophora]KAH0829958.1 hypothetical protein FOPE_10717 [Fonsecaea pedrosoi]OAG33900.1 hypothetical protein AYO21_11986 [Fonsecaea monophora]